MFYHVCNIGSPPNPCLKASEPTKAEHTFPIQLKLTWQTPIRDHNKRQIWRPAGAALPGPFQTFVFHQGISESMSKDPNPPQLSRV